VPKYSNNQQTGGRRRLIRLARGTEAPPPPPPKIQNKWQYQALPTEIYFRILPGLLAAKREIDPNRITVQYHFLHVYKDNLHGMPLSDHQSQSKKLFVHFVPKSLFISTVECGCLLCCPACPWCQTTEDTPPPRKERGPSTRHLTKRDDLVPCSTSETHGAKPCPAHLKT
jgi:hypothetical protein